MPWHIEDPPPDRLAMIGMRLAVCGTTMSGEDRGFDSQEDPPLDDRCHACQGEFAGGRAG